MKTCYRRVHGYGRREDGFVSRQKRELLGGVCQVEGNGLKSKSMQPYI